MATSSRVRGHVYTGFIVCVYIGVIVLLFLPVDCPVPGVWALLSDNHERAVSLKANEAKLVAWSDPARTSLEKLPCTDYVEAVEKRSNQVTETYESLRNIFDTRDDALDRENFLRAEVDRPDRLKEDYDDLVERLSALNSNRELKLAVFHAPEKVYPWAGRDSGEELPPSTAFTSIVKKACVTDVVVRALAATGARSSVRTLTYMSRQKSPRPPESASVREYKARRYFAHRVEVSLLVEFKRLGSLLGGIIGAAGRMNVIQTPERVSVADTRRTYPCPLLVVRSLRFKTANSKWGSGKVDVTMQIDVFDLLPEGVSKFAAPEKPK